MDLSTCVSLRKLMQAYAGWVMLGQVRVMLGQVGSCWDKWGHVGTSGVMLGQVRVMFVCDNFLARSLL